MLRFLTVTLTAVALGAGSAHAILYNANMDGVTAPAGATFTPINGDLIIKSHSNTTAGEFKVLGITGGRTNGEIDLDEVLVIDFAQAQTFDSLSLGLLFDGPEYSDGHEIAAALTDGSTTEFTLTANGLTSATWSGYAGATVVNLSPAESSLGGAWQINNPFGNLSVTQLRLYPKESGAVNESDFGLHAFATQAVPDAGSTLVLLGLGMLGLAGLRRRSHR